MSKTRVALLVVLVLALIGGAAYAYSNNDDGGTQVTTTNEAAPPAKPTLKEMCTEVTRRQVEAKSTYRQAIKDADLARDTAIANVEDPKDIQSATAAANKAHAKAVEDAKAERNATLKTLKVNEDGCARLSNTKPTGTDANEPSGSDSTDPGDASSTKIHYYAYDTDNVNFGPSAPTDEVNNAVRELYLRIDPNAPGRKGGDAALTVSTAEGLGLWKSMTSAERLERTNYLATHAEAWALVRTDIHRYIDGQLASGNVSFGNYSGSYQTMDMQDGDGQTPVIVDTTTHASFVYLNIGGHWFKLSCGYQPVKPLKAPVRRHTHHRTPTGSYHNPVPACPNGLCPKDPKQDVNVNTDVPVEVTGQGTTPIGTSPGEPTDPGQANPETGMPTGTETGQPTNPPAEEGTVTGPATGGSTSSSGTTSVDTATVTSASASVT